MTLEPTEINQANQEGVEQIPARMINEFAYCPRLFYLEHVQGEWAHNADTLDGRFVHRRVDEERGRVPEPAKVVEMPRLHARSVLLGSDTLGVTARVDVIEADDGRVIPVDYKRGAPPDVVEGAYEPERVQVCLQGLLLREHGYECDEGAIYFAETNQRVRVELSEELVARTQELIAEARRVAASGVIPPPLVRSPKCPRCSLVGICLPDETRLLADWAEDGAGGAGGVVKGGVAGGAGRRPRAPPPPGPAAAPGGGGRAGGARDGAPVVGRKGGPPRQTPPPRR